MTDPTLRARFHDLFASVAPDRKDVLDAMRGVYADDMFFQDPMQKVHGIEAFIRTNRKLLSRSRELHFDVGAPVGSDEEFFMTWTMKFRPKLGPAFDTEGVTHIRTKGGRIVYHRDHWDIASLVMTALPGGPALMRAAMRPFV
jgi:hypothetical protein